MSGTLSRPAFWILSALANGRCHGYEIMRATAEKSEGRESLKATTLYAALDRLERNGLVVADGDEVVAGRARRYYRITENGTTRLLAEVELLERAAEAARAHLAAGSATALKPRIAGA